MNWLALYLFCFIAAFPGIPSAAGEGPGLTARQREIVRELDVYKPPWDGAPAGWLLESWDSDKGLGDLAGLPYGEENAASCFKRLAELYPSEKSSLEDGGADSQGVDELLRAADMGMCRFAPDYYPEFDRTDAPQPDLDALRDYLQGLLRRAEKETRAGRISEAERCYRAALVCGWHLTTDKSTSLVFVTGLIYKIRGAQAYAAFLLQTGERDRAERAKNYARTVAELMRAFTWKANVALSEFAGFACLPATIRIATRDAETFWRKEAILRLGTLRYGIVGGKGGYVERDPLFELAADEALAVVAKEDPVDSVRRLAVWVALNVTPKDYERLEHRFIDVLVGGVVD